MRATATGLDSAIVRLQAMANGIQPATDRAMRDYMTLGAARLRAVTKKRSGATAGSIRVVPTATGYSLLAAGPVIDYLLGGTPHNAPGSRIYPTAGRALRFVIDGRVIYAKSVKGMPPDPAMNAVLDEMVSGVSVVASRVGALVTASRRA